ncbi:hypothetical protein BJV74DRAFT_796830 [Russula compacta]|nr:hypothetical protein BJV74DRAFT_796830 [Russula compacta]
MSRATSQSADLEKGSDTDVSRPGRDHPQAEPTQNQSSGEFDYGDSSWPLFSMYTQIAQEEDNKMAECYQKDADATLIFAGLFSATVVTSLTVSIQDLRPDPQQTSAFYLANIYKLLGNQNTSSSSIPLTLAQPPAFSPPNYAIWVNALGFLSMSFALTGAVIATLGQEWAHRYIRATQQSELSPEKRARARAIFANNTQSAWGYAVWGRGRLTFYLHCSLLLFIAAVLIYLFNTCHTVFGAVVCFVFCSQTVYAVVTVEAIFKPDILFYTPFSPLILRVYLSTLYAVVQVSSYINPLRGLCSGTRRYYHHLSDRYREGFLEGKLKATKATASKPSSEIDAGVLEWTFDRLDGDDALEKFFVAIPGFVGSKLVEDLANHLSVGFRIKISQALIGFLDRAFSSDSFSESVGSHRLVICLNATREALGLDGVSGVFNGILNGRWSEALQSVEVGLSLRRWCNDFTQLSSSLRRIVARIVSRVRERDDSWITLVKDEFDIPERVLRENLAHGDSALLAILIHFTRRLLHSDAPSGDPDLLREFSHIDIHSTLPGLRHDFCALWNEIVEEARRHGGGSTPILILKEIRHLYIALHQGTDAAPIAYSDLTTDDDNNLLSLPCDVVEHRPDLTVHVPVPAGKTAQPLTISSLHDVSDTSPFFTPVSPPSLLSPLQGQSLLAASLSVAAAAADASQSGANISTISGTAIPFPHPIPSTGGTHILMPAPSSSAIPAVLSTSKDSTIMRTDYIPHSPGTPSSFSTDARFSMSPQVATVLSQSAAVSIGTAGMQDDTRDQSRPTSMEFFGQRPKSALSAFDIATNTSRREGHQDASGQS